MVTVGVRKVLLYCAALLFTGSGLLHLVRPGPFVKIVPPYIPWPSAMVLISGLAEIAGGIGLLIPVTRRIAGYGLVALLIAVFPANVYMAMNHVQVSVRPVPESLLWARLPLQGVLIAWVLWCARK